MTIRCFAHQFYCRNNYKQNQSYCLQVNVPGCLVSQSGSETNVSVCWRERSSPSVLGHPNSVETAPRWHCQCSFASPFSIWGDSASPKVLQLP